MREGPKPSYIHRPSLPHLPILKFHIQALNRERARRRLLVYLRRLLRSASLPCVAGDSVTFPSSLSLPHLRNPTQTLFQIFSSLSAVPPPHPLAVSSASIGDDLVPPSSLESLEPTPPSVAASSLYRAAAASVHVPAAAPASYPTSLRRLSTGL